MTNIDKSVLKLIDVLIFQKKVKNSRRFCIEANIPLTTPSKVTKGTLHFTVLQLQSICQAYNVNANWLLGMEKNVFNEKNSIEIEDFLLP